MKRHYTMQASTMGVPEGHAGWWFSEKYDGEQAIWDGGFTRGMSCRDVPYAYTDKHSRYVTEPLATGLWSRYAQPIQAPSWWLDALPPVPLTGEIWAGFGNWQLVSKARKLVPIDSEWEPLTFRVFDSPHLSVWLAAGTISLPQMELTIPPGTVDWCLKHGAGLLGQRGCLAVVYDWLECELPCNEIVHLVSQVEIECVRHLDALYESVLLAGGEGGIIRDPMSFWVPGRSRKCLKQKPFLDAEATVVGWTGGAGKHLGRMGALLVNWGKGDFKIGNGFTDADRLIDATEALCPGDTDLSCGTPVFPLGTVVTFKYRELSDTGVPKEARFWRIRP